MATACDTTGKTIGENLDWKREGRTEEGYARHPGRVFVQGPGVCTRGSLSVILGLSDLYLCLANPDVLQIAQAYLVQM